MLLLLVVHCLVLTIISHQIDAQFEPNWDSLDTRVIPPWYDQAKVGIFLHWGVYSVPSFVSEWFWFYWADKKMEPVVDFMEKNYPPGFTYQDFAKEFTAEFFEPSEWAELFRKSGAKYVVLTSKHHEGYTLWPSKYSYSWNAIDVGPHRDLVLDLADAVRDSGLHFGLYHSLFEWYNPIYDQDRANNFTTSTFVDNKIIPEMKELINTYEPEILWSDGDGEAPDSYWKSTEFLAWLYNESPVRNVIVTNDRWGSNVGCKHGDFYTCADRYNPGVLQQHKWENAMTIDAQSWGYRRNIEIADILTIHDLIVTMAQTISCGGNILINVGPTKEGTIAPIFQERLLELGTWLSINGEGIYESSPWTAQNDSFTPGIWYTSKGLTVYGIVLEWPIDNTLKLGSVADLFLSETTTVEILGNSEKLEWTTMGDLVQFKFPDQAALLSKWAWVLKIQQSPS